MDILQIKLGQSANLSWEFDNAQTVVIDQGIGAVPRKGEIKVSPVTDTIYTLTATNYLGISTTSQLQVSILYPPSITSLSPDSGIPGDTITINGSNFDPIDTNNIIQFLGPNGSFLTASVVSGNSSQLQVTVPTMALSGPVQVIVNGQISNSVRFTLNQINNFISTVAPYPLFNFHEEGASFSYQEKGFILCGPDNSIEMYQPINGIPASLSALSGSRAGFPVARRISHLAYVIGGNDQFNITQRYTEKLDLLTGEWEVLGLNSLFPEGYNGTNRCGSEIGTDIYFFTETATLKFDTLTGDWDTSLPAKPNTPLYGKAITFNEEIYVFGGDSGNSEVWKFNSSSGWIQMTSNPTGMKGHSLALLDNYIIVTGGEPDPSATALYNPSTDTWKTSYNGELPTLPPTHVKFNHTSEVLNGELYLFGGNSKEVIKLTPYFS